MCHSHPKNGFQVSDYSQSIDLGTALATPTSCPASSGNASKGVTMKSKLITMAVVSTFGWSAGAFAATGHEVITPFSVNDTGEVLPQQHSGGFASSSSRSHDTSMMSSPTYGDASGTFSSADQSASLNMDENLALNEGIFTDVYVVSWTPAASEDWMSYVQPDQVALSDDGTAYVASYD